MENSSKDVTSVSRGRKRRIDNLKLYSFRLDADVVDQLRSDFGVNLNAQINAYLGVLCFQLCLRGLPSVSASHYVYTK